MPSHPFTSPANGTPIPLWPGAVPQLNPGWTESGWVPTITPYLLDTKEPSGMVLVVPGGGYNGRAEHEREPIARFFNKAGLSSAVVDYRTQCHDSPAPLGTGPLLDGQRAVRFVRAHATSWRIRPDRIAVVGFSAGGHLCGMLATRHDSGNAASSDPVERASCRPDAAILCYAAVLPHPTVCRNILGDNYAEEDYEFYSSDKHVSPQTSPSFLWHTAEDTGVPPRNSVVMAEALWAKGINAELHIFPKGPHGLGLAAGHLDAAQWTGLCTAWLRGLGF